MSTVIPIACYEPMTLSQLAGWLEGGSDAERWRYVAGFLKEFSWEPPIERLRLLQEGPATTGDERWDTFIAALAEHLERLDVIT